MAGLGIGGDSNDMRYDGKKKNLIDKAMDFITPKPKVPTPPPAKPLPGNPGDAQGTVDAIRKRKAALDSIK